MARHRELALALARAFPEVDEETLADSLEGVSGVPELLAALRGPRMDDELLTEVLKRRIEQMRQRLQRLGARAEQKRCFIIGAAGARAEEARRDGLHIVAAGGHSVGDERDWWSGHRIDPISEANRLWRHKQSGLAKGQSAEVDP